MKKIIVLLSIGIFPLLSFSQNDECSNSERALVNIRPDGLSEISALKMIRGQKNVAFLGDSTKNVSVSVFPPMVKTRHYQTKILFSRNPELLDSYWNVDHKYISSEEPSSINWALITTWIIVFAVGLLLCSFVLELFFGLDPEDNSKKHFTAGTIGSVILGSLATIFYSINLIGPSNLTWAHFASIISFMYLGYLILFLPFWEKVFLCVDYIFINPYRSAV